MERFNGLMKELIRNVNGSAKKFEQYFFCALYIYESAVCLCGGDEEER